MPNSDQYEKQQYTGNAKKILDKFGASTGSSVRVETADGLVTSGLLLPRYEHLDSEHIVIKLKSGYNIGVRADKIKTIAVLEKQISAPTSVPAATGKKSLSAKKLLLLSTGGTIASRIDYRTGAVHPALSASDLYSAIPELDEIATILPEVVFSVYSENMGPKQWEILSQAVLQKSQEKSPDGTVVMIGTDTLAYASAALSFSLIGLKSPVVFVGAQRSTDRPSSDGALNLKGAARFAVNSEIAGVFVAMHETENDDSIAIHSGVRVRKNHTSRRDAFQSIDAPLVGRVKGKDVLLEEFARERPKVKDDHKLKTKFEENVALVKFHPGFDHNILDFLWKQKMTKGIIIEGTGLGHVSSGTVERISELTKNGVFVGITSQCIRGHVDLNVYDTGRDMIAAGAVPLENMISETAFAKLSWAIANFENVKDVMKSNLLGESTERISLDA